MAELSVLLPSFSKIRQSSTEIVDDKQSQFRRLGDSSDSSDMCMKWENVMDASLENESAIESGKTSLWTRGFIALLVTQFMVALNDNIFRWLIIPIGKCAIGWSDNPDAIRTIGSLAFLVPFLLFATYAGFACDRYNRRSLLIWCKVAELLVMILGTMAIVSQSVPFMLVTLFLMASQSTFFSPAKYGSLPNLVAKERISEANGYIAMTTMVACLGGQVLGGVLFVMTTLSPEAPAEGTGGMHHWFIWASVIIGVAILGLISSLFIPSIKPANPNVRFPLNPFGETISDIRFLLKHRFLFWVAIASSLYWGLGALAQINIDKFATEYLNVRQDWAMCLLVTLSAGLALGSLLAGKLSRGRIELGLVPIGAAFIALFCFVLSLTPSVSVPHGFEVASPTSLGFVFGAVFLALMGLAAGLFDIPLLATLQMQSPKESRGRILATYNFFSFSAMALAAVFQGALASPPFGLSKYVSGLNSAMIWLVAGILVFIVFAITLFTLLIPFLRVCVSWWLRLYYKLNENGADNIPEEGGVLLVGSHVSLIDALVVYCTSKRPVRFIADSKTLPKKNFLCKYVIKKLNTIVFDLGDHKSGLQMIRSAQEALKNGDVVCIFPEGALTRDGQVRAFKKGFLSILRNNPDIPVVPFAITGFHGSRFSKIRLEGYHSPAPYRPGINYGAPVSVDEYIKKGYTQEHINQILLHKVQELNVEMTDYRKHPENVWLYTPARAAIRGLRLSYKKLRHKIHLADSTGKELDGKKTLLSILVLRHALHRAFKNDQFIGVLLPTSVVGVLINAALSFDRKVPINLNYTFTNDVNDYCIKKLGIKNVVTSKQLLKKLPNLKINANLIALEDFAQTNVKVTDKLIGFLQSLLPTVILERVLGLTKEKLHDINTIVFTSGSTGLPKGTILSNLNVAANVFSFGYGAHPLPTMSIFGCLPFFHSFGYTVTVWFPLCLPYPCVYHYNPLDYKGVGAVVKKYAPTLMVSTPTFMRTYLKKCTPEEFKSVDFPIVGAEKTQKNLYIDWKEKFGYGLNEGYGATEMAPVMSNCIPEWNQPDTVSPYHKDYSVGSPNPNFVAKIVDAETGEELPPNTPGLLLAKGNSVTDGYYQDPERSAKIFRDGWYVTGDIAYLDEDNFLFITGRETRMSKIAGEMAPHGLIEEKLIEAMKTLSLQAENKQDSSSDDSSTIPLVVTAVPDEKKGEKLVVLYVDLPFTPEQICKEALAEGTLPQLWIPSTLNFKQVDSIPVLGSGKLDLKRIKQTALDLYGLKDAL